MTVEMSSHIEGFIPTAFQKRLALRELNAGVISLDQLTQSNRDEQYRILESMIGNTPLLFTEGPNHSAILVKDESQNPTESHYDRVYIATLKRLEEDGVIKPGDELWEVTSGSAGISFAWLASRLGYKARIFVPKRLDEARKQEMRNFGAEVVEVTKIVTDPVTGEEADVAYVPEASKEQTRQFVRLGQQGFNRKPPIETEDYNVRVAEAEGKPNVCLVNHSWNHISHKALEAIGDEVSAILPRGAGIDYFISILGNGSNTRGVADSLRRRFKRIQVVGLETEENPVWYVQKYPGRYEKLFGHEPTYEAQEMYGGSSGGGDKLIKFITPDLLDAIRIVNKKEWRDYMQQYNAGRQPGETIGRSSAASLVLANQIGQENLGSYILVLHYDKGDRYGDPNLRGQDYQTVPLDGWRQQVARSPVDLPMNLRDSYIPAEERVRKNITRLRHVA